MMNTLSYIFLFALITSIAIQSYLTYRQAKHVRSHKEQVPDKFSENISLSAHQKAANYTVAKVNFNLVQMIINSLFLLGWTLGGGLQWLDNILLNLTLPTIWHSVVLIFSVLTLMTLLSLPLELYRTFKLEQHFGFNKMTLRLFFIDMIKNTFVTLLFGIPLLLLVLWIMQNDSNLWWGYLWLVWLSFSIFMMWAYPAFIAPFFNTFRPLENDALEKRIDSLLSRNGFKSQGVYVMDGSSRSTHGNAYFTGLGSNKRIVFFDTLIDELSHDEIEAVLAHELGHFKCHHIRKRIITLGIVFLSGFALLGWLANELWFYTGLGVSASSNHMALLLFILIAPAFTFFLQPLFSFISRQHEFEADNFAAGQAQSKNLISALVSLYRENANTLTPDPLFSAFHDSHPPAPIRITQLESQPV